MFAVTNLIVAFARLLDLVLDIYFFIIIGRAVISWVNPDPYNPIVRFLYQATEPVLRPVRKLLPYMGGMDVSPIIVLLILRFGQWFVVKTLMDLAYRFQAGGGM